MNFKDLHAKIRHDSLTFNESTLKDLIKKVFRKNVYNLYININNCVITSIFNLIMRIEIFIKMGHDHIRYCPKAWPLLNK